MSRKELPRAGLVQAALAGKITNREGAVVLHPDHVAISAARSGGSAKMASLLCDLYAGFNDTQLTEKLREVHKLAVSRESVRLRLPLGRPAVHRRRPAQHRTRRPRKAPAGQLLQLDGSPFCSSRGVAQRSRFSARSTMRRRRSSRCISGRPKISTATPRSCTRCSPPMAYPWRSMAIAATSSRAPISTGVAGRVGRAAGPHAPGAGAHEPGGRLCPRPLAPSQRLPTTF